MISSQDRIQPETAREIQEKHEEKLLILGPVLERNQNELLDPLIDNVFEYALAANLFPPPPEEMQGQEINVEYVSMLAQAQKSVGIGSIDRLLGQVGGMAQFNPAILDKLKPDEIVDAYADMLGVAPSLIMANADVAIIRKQRAEALAKQQQLQAIQQGAETMKTMSETETPEGGNALDQITAQFSSQV